MTYVPYSGLQIERQLTAEQKIQNWFRNNVTKKDVATKTKQVKVKVSTARDVIKSTYKDRIHQYVSEKTQANVGHKDWLSKYPAAVSRVMEELTDAQLQDAAQVAEEWNTNGVPRDMQKAYVSTLMCSTNRIEKLTFYPEMLKRPWRLISRPS
jgi:chromosomal replication initiation ATPase DnaA